MADDQADHDADQDADADTAASADVGDGHDGADRHCVVPAEVPHAAPVLDLASTAVLRYTRDLLEARDRHDSEAALAVGRWLYANPEEAPEFLFGLAGLASLTADLTYGSGGRSAAAQVAADNCAYVAPATEDRSGPFAEGFRMAAALADHRLTGNMAALEPALEAMPTRVPLAWATAVGLADITIGLARRKWGDASQYLAAALSVTGDPQRTWSMPDVADELAAAFAQELGQAPEPSPNSATDSAQGRRSWTSVQIAAGARLAPSFLCYYDSGARHSQRQIREWLEANPHSTLGFLKCLALCTYTVVSLAYGRDTAAKGTRTILDEPEPDLVPPEMCDVPSRAEFDEGVQTGVAVLYHMLVGDFSANTVLLVRLQESMSLTWGAAVFFADALVGVTRGEIGCSTALVHHLHSFTAALIREANPASQAAAS